MGSSTSTPIHHVPDTFPFMCLTLTSNSTPSKSSQEGPALWLTYPSPTALDVIRAAIANLWPPGLSREQVLYGDGYIFYLQPAPSTVKTDEAKLHVASLVCSILNQLHHSGCQILHSSDLSRLTDTVTWILQRSPDRVATGPLVAPPTLGCIAITRNKQVKLINLPEHTHLPVLSSVMKSFGHSQHGVQYDKAAHTYTISTQDATEQRLHPTNTDSPSPNQETSEPSPTVPLDIAPFILDVIPQLKSFGWKFFSASNLDFGLDALFFKYTGSLPNLTRTQFAISLTKTDRMRIYGTRIDDIVNTIRNSIKSVWKDGVKKTESFEDYIELKFKSSPWYSSGSDNLRSKLVMVKILEALQARGWKPLEGVQIRDRNIFNEKVVIVFEQQDEAPCSLPVFCLSLRSDNMIGVINTTEGIVQIIRDLLNSKWIWEVKQEKSQSQNAWLWKLNKKPWSGGPSEMSFHAHSLLCLLLEQLHYQNCSLLLSADICSKVDVTSIESGEDNKSSDIQVPQDPHCLFFTYNQQPAAHSRHDPGASPSAPYTRPDVAPDEQPPPYEEAVPTTK